MGQYSHIFWANLTSFSPQAFGFRAAFLLQAALNVAGVLLVQAFSQGC